MRNDKLLRGEENTTGPLGHFGQSFLLFKTTYMKHDWIKDWKYVVRRNKIESNDQSVDQDKNLCDPIVLPGYTTTTDRLDIALIQIEGVDSEVGDEYQRVLFMIVM